MGVTLDSHRTGDTVGGTVIYTELGYRLAFGVLAGTVGVAFLCSLWLLGWDR